MLSGINIEASKTYKIVWENFNKHAESQGKNFILFGEIK